MATAQVFFQAVDELVAQIATTSQEQTQGIVQINAAVSDMDRVTQNNAAMAEKSSHASEELHAQSETLKVALGQLLVLVDGEKALRPAPVSIHGSGNKDPLRTESEVKV